MTHPLQSYFYDVKDGHIPDQVAKDDITGLVNDPDLVRDVCACFRDRNNLDATCYAIGKVYDVGGESYGCVSILSEDVTNIIGEPLDDVQEQINFMLINTYLEFRRVCNGSAEIFDAWDGYVDTVMSKSFLPLYENGIRARLIYNGRIHAARLPTVVFVVYQQYDALYR
ncbi:MAG: hypothetical protein A4E28_02667 [Methanocella sp. PtaU1.Bin125]|nr:MAG: hypothetical protein A4E28_02667 [Methanocella sp. PtaU1.Bin125]